MPLNITNAESAVIAGKAKFESWRAKFEDQWNQPLKEMGILLMYDRMTPAMREWYKKNTPEAYADLEKLVSEIKSRNGG